jgi:hypothetical protein
MPRRIQWGLLLLVAVAFVAPGTARASTTGARDARAASAGRASALGPSLPQLSSTVVRQGVDLDDSRSEKAGAGTRRLYVGAGTSGFAPPSNSRRTRLVDRRDGYRSSRRTTVLLRAPPSIAG